MEDGQFFAGRFRLEERIGEGGVGIVYRGIELNTDAITAIKILRPEYAQDGKVRRRFMREGRAISRLMHPNIVQVYHCGTDDQGTVYIAMELVDGQPMSELRDEVMPISRLLGLIDQLLAALAYTHARGVIHRDVKPENLLVTKPAGPGLPETVKLLDFGFARVDDDEDPQHRDGFGTPQYMAPEQAAGKGIVGPAADLYAVGVILYEFLAGKPPFTGTHGMAVALKHIMEEAPPLVPRVGLLPRPGLIAVVMRALRKDPVDRFGSAAEMRRELAPFHRPDGPLVTPVPGAVSAAAAHIARLAFESVSQAPVAGLPPVVKTVIPPTEEIEPSTAPIGRDDDVVWLWQEARNVCQLGQGRIVLLGADIGMGKSQTIRFVREQIAEGGWMQCGGWSQEGSGQGLRGVFAGLFGELPANRAAAWAQIQRIILGWDDERPFVDRDVEIVLNFLRPERMAGDEAVEITTGEVLFERLCDVLERAANDHPVLMVLEGLEGGGPTAGRFLIHLANRLVREPFAALVVATHATGLEQVSPAVEETLSALMPFGSTVVKNRVLRPLDQQQVTRLLSSILPLDDETGQRIAGQVEGNPLFARELILYLQCNGSLLELGGRYSLMAGVDSSSWPHSLPLVLLARAQQLVLALEDGTHALQLLEHAALLGRAFDYSLLVDYLVRIFGDQTRVEHGIESLLQVELFVEAPGYTVDRVRFRYQTLRDELLSRLTAQAESARLHRKAAEALVSHLGADTPQLAERIAAHFELGGKTEQGARYYAEAARQARIEGRPTAAFEMIKRGDALLVKSSSSSAQQARASLWLDLGEMELRRGGYDRAQQLAIRVHHWARSQEGVLVMEGRALLLLGDVLRRKGNFSDAARSYQRAAQTFARTQEMRWVGRSLIGIARVEQSQGRLTEAEHRFGEALEQMQRLGFDRGIGQAAQGLGEIALRQEQYSGARTVLLIAYQAYTRAGERAGSVFCGWLLGEVMQRLGEFEVAIEYLDSACTGYVDAGDLAGAARAERSLARVLDDTGRTSAATKRYRQVIEAFEQLGDLKRAADTREELGHLLLSCHEFMPAERTFREVLDHVLSVRDEGREATLRGLVAWAAAGRGDWAAVKVELDRSLSLSDSLALADEELAAALDAVGELTAQHGQSEWAVQLLQRSSVMFAALGEDAEAERVHNRMKQFGSWRSRE